jgi:hypothetical protein
VEHTAVELFEDELVEMAELLVLFAFLAELEEALLVCSKNCLGVD